MPLSLANQSSQCVSFPMCHFGAVTLPCPGTVIYWRIQKRAMTQGLRNAPCMARKSKKTNPFNLVKMTGNFSPIFNHQK